MNRQLSNVGIKMTQFPGGFHLNYLKDIIPRGQSLFTSFS